MEILRVVMEQQDRKLKDLQKEAYDLNRTFCEVLQKAGFGWLLNKKEFKS